VTYVSCFIFAKNESVHLDVSQVACVVMVALKWHPVYLGKVSSIIRIEFPEVLLNTSQQN